MAHKMPDLPQVLVPDWVQAHWRRLAALTRLQEARALSADEQRERAEIQHRLEGWEASMLSILGNETPHDQRRGTNSRSAVP